MPNLEHLNLKRNYISFLPEKLKYCGKLKKLELGTNEIHSGESLENLPPNLTKLDLSNNKIQIIPGAITCLKNLEELHLDTCGLSRIPADIKNLQKLRVLNICNNSIRTIPRALGKLSSLRELIIDKNKLREIPDVIGNCYRLSKLSAGENNLSQISPAVGKCGELNQLQLSKNKLKTLPDSLKNCLTLQLLDLSRNKFEQLPEVVLELKWLSKFFLNHNALSEIDFKDRVGWLSFLDLSHNNIASVRNLPPSLKTLHLVNNKLTEFPEAVKNCINLRRLQLNQNKISQIPKDFGPMADTLEIWGMEKNPAKASPEQLLPMTAMEGFSGLMNSKQQLAVLAILKACRQNLIPASEKFLFLRLLLDGKPEGQRLPLSSLIPFLNVNYPSVTQKIRKYLYLRFGISLARKRLNKGHQLAIVGETNFDLPVLRERLESQGVKLVEKGYTEASHVLLGWGPMEWSGDPQGKVIFLSEKRLCLELWRLEEAHLLRNPDPEVLRSVEDLLHSKEKVNIQLGLELLKTGGVNNHLMNYLIGNWLRLLKDPELSDEFLRIIKLNSEDDWKFLLDRYSKSQFFQYVRNVEDRKAPEPRQGRLFINKKLVPYFKKNKLDTALIKKALFKK